MAAAGLSAHHVTLPWAQLQLLTPLRSWAPCPHTVPQARQVQAKGSSAVYVLWHLVLACGPPDSGEYST